MRLKLFKLIAGISFGLLWALILTEVSLRFMVAQGQMPNRLPADIFASHPIGWALEPEQKLMIPGFDGLIEIQTNTRGFRDQDYALVGAEGPRRLVLGDSFTLALETPQAQVFHARLEADPALEAGEIISLGVSGYELLQHLLIYQEEGRRYGADEVWLMLYVGNDLHKNEGWPQYPHYVLGTDGGLSLQAFPYEGPFNLPLVASQRSTPLMRQSVLAFLLGTLTRQSPFLPSDGTGDYCDYWARVNYPQPSPEDWQLSAALLRALQAAVLADGARLRVAILPTEFQVDQMQAWDFAERCNFTPPPPIQEPLIALLQAEGIPYLDLLPALSAAQAAGEQMYWTNDDIHWTAAGHGVVAEALQQAWIAP